LRLRRALVATAAAIAPLPYRKARLSHHLTRYCRNDLAVPDAAVTVAARPGDPGDHLVVLSQHRLQLRATCSDQLIRQKPNEIYARLTSVLAVIVRVPIEPFRVIADISDGECSGPGLVSFCSRDPRAILIPDHMFVWSQGYAELRRQAQASRIPWRARSDLVVWRGQTTGQGQIATDNLSTGDTGLLPRVRLCLLLKKIPGTDAKISGIAQSFDPEPDRKRLAQAGILGEFIPPAEWLGFKFAIDIDGNSNAWSNLFTRLLMGCCVLKVASPRNYRQWYYDDLKPWTHFVPVKADLSDLTDQIAWCHQNLDACERIAADGQAFAMAHRYDQEIVAAVGRLVTAFQHGELVTALPVGS
jgi:hypothetical protein